MGIRECFVPRPGYVFAQADFDQLELRTLAQVCISLFGQSRLGELLNAGRDPHTALAADILGIPYEEAMANRKRQDVDAARQVAKVANFGYPGGLGIQKLMLFARKTYKVILTERQTRQLKDQWFASLPEMKLYFDYVGQECNNDEGLARVVHLFSGRIRGACTYTAACNSRFQGLGADAAKRALWRVSRASYAEPDSPLYGSRVVNFIHDEIISEVRDDAFAHDAAYELARLMVLGANEFLPDVPAKTEPLLMRHWSKDAKALFDEKGRLVPWDG